LEIRLQGYAGDCTVTGRMELEGRLSDALDRSDEIVLSDASLLSLADGRRIDLPELTLERDDLFAVEGHGSPAGEDQRRVRMVRHLLQLQLGPYTCYGELHSLPGAAPLRALVARRTMVPLTSCVLVFRRGDEDEIRRVPMLVVNGARIDHVEEVTMQQVENEIAALATRARATIPSSPFAS
jgi:hypothetical protein